MTGPIHAGIFPNAAFDPTLGTVSLFRFPATTPTNYGEAKQMFSFGLIEIAQDGKLVASINGIHGGCTSYNSIRTENPIQGSFLGALVRGFFNMANYISYSQTWIVPYDSRVPRHFALIQKQGV